MGVQLRTCALGRIVSRLADSMSLGQYFDLCSAKRNHYRGLSYYG